MKVAIFVPCFIDQLFPQTAFNTIKILEYFGCEVTYPTNQTCCGQPLLNSGCFKEATEIADKFIEDFAAYDVVVSPSASCVGMVKNSYPEILKLNPKFEIYELSYFLISVLKINTLPTIFNHSVTIHHSCSGLRECGIKQEVIQLVKMVSGIQYLEMPKIEECCGFGGTFAVKFPEISGAMAQQKLENAIQTQAEYLISTDSSCLLHLEGYAIKQELPIKTIHIADLLAQGW
jgi:L-lactate dehydrogenase complex protein LldE